LFALPLFPAHFRGANGLQGSPSVAGFLWLASDIPCPIVTRCEADTRQRAVLLRSEQADKYYTHRSGFSVTTLASLLASALMPHKPPHAEPSKHT